MEQFQSINVIFHIHHRTVECQGVVHNFMQGIRIYILAKESAGYGVGNLLKTHFLDVVEKLLGQLVDTLGHIQSAILSQSLNYCFVQVGNRSLAVGAIVLHIFLM